MDKLLELRKMKKKPSRVYQTSQVSTMRRDEGCSMEQPGKPGLQQGALATDPAAAGVEASEINVWFTEAQHSLFMAVMKPSDPHEPSTQ